jgi:hypothetical protein
VQPERKHLAINSPLTACCCKRFFGVQMGLLASRLLRQEDFAFGPFCRGNLLYRGHTSGRSVRAVDNHPVCGL